MNYSIENEFLKITVSRLGAELVSVVSKDDGCEYIWQGESGCWGGHSPVLFPFCCRLFDGYYTYKGEKHVSGIHGFARANDFNEVNVEDGVISMSLYSNEKLKELYPFDFKLTVSYKLEEKRVRFGIDVENTGDEEMIFTEGFHPGFNLPMGDTEFEDWYIEFDCEKTPDRILFSDACFCTGSTAPYNLKNGKILPLSYDIFDSSGIFLKNHCKYLTLKSQKSTKSVRIECPDFKYLGFWHERGKISSFICIEPMNGLPSLDGKVDDLTEKTDMSRVSPKNTCSFGFDLIIG